MYRYKHTLDTISTQDTINNRVIQLPAIRHFRESEKKSGLFVIAEIGRTIMGITIKNSEPYLPDLYLPVDFENSERAPSDEPLDITTSIIAPRLDDFVPTGLQAWGLLCRANDRETSEVYLYEGENHRPDDEPVNRSGLKILRDNPETTFISFLGTADELEQLQKFRNAINDSATVPDELGARTNGQYL